MSTVQQVEFPSQVDNYLEQTFSPLLDLFSTTVTNPKCIYHAPYICIPPSEGNEGKLYQTCCNHWDCPRCGPMRARYEYGRIVEGARQLASENPDLYFVTLTCSGTVNLEVAEQTYYDNTHKLLRAFQAQVKRAGGLWAYAAVTERQQRGHPHSHLLMTCAPSDAFIIVDDYQRYASSVTRINAKIPSEMRFTASPLKDLSFLDMHSEWLMLASVRVGLGVQARVSLVDSVEACSRYIAKYLFKDSIATVWPEGWKRVRYSQNWPDLPQNKASSAFPVLSRDDWERVRFLDGQIACYSETVYRAALARLLTNVICKVSNNLDVNHETA